MHLEDAVERIFSDWQQTWMDAVEESSLVIAAEFTAFTICRIYHIHFLQNLLY
jgi:hypothetical protein